VYRATDSEKKWSVEIHPGNGWLDLHLKELVSYKDLIFLFVRRTFVAKYKQTVLGPVWAIIQPFLTTVVYTLFFGNIAGLGAKGVPTFIFYLSGTVIWGVFSQGLTQSANTFTANRAILSKVYFPRLVMPISSTLSEFISFGIQFFFMICFLLYYLFTGSGVAPNIFMLMTPVLLLQLALLGLGFGIIVSSLTTKYRDLAMLIAFGVQLWSFASPVAYDMYRMAALAPGGKYYGLYMLNPITPLINIFRYAFLGIGNIDWTYYIIGWITTVVVFFIGIVLFSRIEKTFADTV
jgi:lipopolysaccharide transport system permease protein